MVDGCRQEKGVPHVRTRDDRHTGLPRPLPQLRRPPGLLRRPVGNPRTCEARRGNAMHGRDTGRGGIRALHAGNAVFSLNILLQCCYTRLLCVANLLRRYIYAMSLNLNMSFSERHGIAAPKQLQVDSMDKPLQNGLWNAIDCFFISDTRMVLLRDVIWTDFFKEVEEISYARHLEIRNRFLLLRWYDVYEFIEFIYAQVDKTNKFSRISTQSRYKHLSLSIERQL